MRFAMSPKSTCTCTLGVTPRMLGYSLVTGTANAEPSARVALPASSVSPAKSVWTIRMTFRETVALKPGTVPRGMAHLVLKTIAPNFSLAAATSGESQPRRMKSFGCWGVWPTLAA